MTTTRFLDKLLERVERIDRSQLEDYIKSLVWENAFLRDAIDKIEEGILIIDKNSRLKVINSTAEYLLGISGNKLTDKRLSQYPLDPILLGVLDKAIAHPEKTFQQELYATFPREQLLRVFACPIIGRIEEITGWIVTIQDITEFRRTSAQKFQTEKIKALITMASILAHELGNPLNSLGIHLQLINRAIKTFPKKHKDKILKLSNIAQTEVKRLDNIVTRFLQATRPLKPRFFEGDINRILDDTLEFLDHELRKNNIEVIKDYSSEIPKIYFDHVQMRQAFINIIKNAVEAMPKNGKLEIQTVLDKNIIKISFIDNGVGIPGDELDKIFEPYYSSKRSGSGLGLVVVHRIIHDHGGQIDLKSKLGKGTTVTIFLPTEPIGPKLLPQGRK